LFAFYFLGSHGNISVDECMDLRALHEDVFREGHDIIYRVSQEERTILRESVP
jgi:hypothetical protein